MAGDEHGVHRIHLWRPAAVAVIAGWVAIVAASFVVLQLTHWLNGIGSFPIDTVASIMATWFVFVLFALAVWEAISGPSIQVADRYMPTIRPRWWMPPIAGLVGLALGWAFWR
jgi:hypothetical protein